MDNSIRIVKAPAEQYITKDTLDDIRMRVQEDVERVWNLFQAKHETARRNQRFTQSDQWDDIEKQAFERQYRIPYVFDEISPKLNHLLGLQQATRLDAKLVPQEPDDSKGVELLGRLLKWSEQMNDISTIESSVFRDMCVKAFGASVVRWELTDVLNGFPKIERIPIYQLVWDLNSCEIDMSDCRWIARVIPMTRADAVELYPEFQKEIESASSIDSSSVFRYHQAMTARQQMDTNSSYQYLFGREYVQIIEHYEKLRKQFFVVVDTLNETTDEFENYADAVSYADGLLDSYTQDNYAPMDETGGDIVFIASKFKDCVYQSVLVGDVCVSYEETDLPDFPYQIGFAYFDDGDYWSPVDQMIHPQIFMNRMMSEWDNQIGRSAKHLTTVIPNALEEGWTTENVREEKSKTGAVIPVRSHEAIQQHPNQPSSPDIPATVQYAKQHMIESVGGLNALGFQQNAAESGKAVRARQEAAGTARLPLFDHLLLWRKKVTEMVVWYLKNLTTEGQVIRIIGKNNAVDFSILDDDQIESLRELRTDVFVEEAPDTDSAQEEQFAQLTQVISSMPGIPPEIALPMLIKASKFSEDDKKELLSQMQFYQTYMQQQAQLAEQEKLKKSVDNSIQRQQMKQQAELEQNTQQQQPQGEQ